MGGFRFDMPLMRYQIVERGSSATSKQGFYFPDVQSVGGIPSQHFFGIAYENRPDSFPI